MLPKVQPGVRPFAPPRPVPALAPVDPCPGPVDCVTLGAPVAATPALRAAGSAPAACAAAPAASPRRDWRDEILYFVMVDRFADGDRSNDAGCDPENPEKFHGGDWRGVIDHLDDLDRLGVTTLWLSPPYLNDPDFLGMQGYHGYWVQDFYRPDPHLGDMKTLRELVEKAHQKGMKVILDLIVNHTGYNHPWVHDPAKYGWYHHEGDLHVPTRHNLENCNLRGLPDLAQENPQVSDYLTDHAKWWVRQTGIDGFRVDAVKHVPQVWLRKFSDELHRTFGPQFLLVGEAYDNSPARVAPYQSKAHLDSLFDFPVSDAVRSAIGYDDGRGELGVLHDAVGQIMEYPYEAWRLLSTAHGDMRLIADRMESDRLYDRPAMLATIIDNHDMPRFASVAGPDARAKLKLALTFLLTSRGIPCLYQGTEDGMGLHGEGNRDDKRWGQDPELFATVSRLTHLRRDSEALRRGAQVVVHSDRDVLAFGRVAPRDQVMVVLNRAADGRELKLALPETMHLRDGDVLVDVVSGQRHPVRGGCIAASVAPRGALVLRRTEGAGGSGS